MSTFNHGRECLNCLAIDFDGIVNLDYGYSHSTIPQATERVDRGLCRFLVAGFKERPDRYRDTVGELADCDLYHSSSSHSKHRIGNKLYFAHAQIRVGWNVREPFWIVISSCTAIEKRICHTWVGAFIRI